MNSKDQGRRILVVLSGLGFLLMSGILAPPAQLLVTTKLKIATKVKIATRLPYPGGSSHKIEDWETTQGIGTGSLLHGKLGDWTVWTSPYAGSLLQWQDSGNCQGNGTNSVGFFHSQGQCDYSGGGITGTLTSAPIPMPTMQSGSTLQSFTLSFDYIASMGGGDVFQFWMLDSTGYGNMFSTPPSVSAWTNVSVAPTSASYWTSLPNIQLMSQFVANIVDNSYAGPRWDNLRIDQVWTSAIPQCGNLYLLMNPATAGVGMDVAFRVAGGLPLDHPVFVAAGRPNQTLNGITYPAPLPAPWGSSCQQELPWIPGDTLELDQPDFSLFVSADDEDAGQEFVVQVFDPVLYQTTTVHFTLAPANP